MVSGGTLLLSPHSDDTAMSAFGILRRKLLPEPVTLLAVFTFSNYFVDYGRARPGLRVLAGLVPRPNELLRSLKRNAGRFGTMNPWGIVKKLIDLEQPYKITRMRLLEDLAFSRTMGIQYRHLGLADCKFRHGTPLMNPDLPLSNEHETVTLVNGAVERVAKRLGSQALVAPWPYGGTQHLDHRIVNESAVEVAEKSRMSLYYVDDQPYSRRPLQVTADRRNNLYTPVTVELSRTEVQSKIKAMNLYWSQMVPEYWRAMARPPPGAFEASWTETLWKSEV